MLGADRLANHPKGSDTNARELSRALDSRTINARKKLLLGLTVVAVLLTLCRCPWQVVFEPKLSPISPALNTARKSFIRYGPLWSPPQFGGDSISLEFSHLVVEWAAIGLVYFVASRVINIRTGRGST